MFIAALFVIARTWKQPRCSSEDEWIRRQWYIYTMEYYSAIKKNSSSFSFIVIISYLVPLPTTSFKLYVDA